MGFIARSAMPVEGGRFWTSRGFTMHRGRMEWANGTRISGIRAMEILDSRGTPTVMAELTLNSGAYAVAKVPSGASTGGDEACELRDGDKSRYMGKGVLNAVANVNDSIAPALIGMPVFEQRAIDQTMINLDGTADKSKLGANAILAVSMAAARAASIYAYGPTAPVYRYIGGDAARVLPVPMENSFNGGAHGEWVTDIQEFMIMPIGARSFAEGQRMVCEVYAQIGKVLKDVGYGKGLGIGNEGGYNPYLDGKFYTKFGEKPVMGVNAEVLWIFQEAVRRAGYVLGKDIAFTMDGAVSALEDPAGSGNYTFKRDGITRTSLEQAAFYAELIRHIRGPQDQKAIVSIEDGLSEVDWNGWVGMNKMLGRLIQIVLDDPTCTNIRLLQKGIGMKAANAILIKLNQIGTLSETLDTIDEAERNGYGRVISHRSGETEDDFIADLAVGVNAGQLKTGGPQRSDRNSKYNRLLWIERELGDKAIYPGASIFNNEAVYDAQYPG